MEGAAAHPAEQKVEDAAAHPLELAVETPKVPVVANLKDLETCQFGSGAEGRPDAVPLTTAQCRAVHEAAVEQGLQDEAEQKKSNDMSWF